jgi:CRP-like cAMP-binding protein
MSTTQTPASSNSSTSRNNQNSDEENRSSTAVRLRLCNSFHDGQLNHDGQLKSVPASNSRIFRDGTEAPLPIANSLSNIQESSLASTRRTKNKFLLSLSEELWARLTPHIGHALMFQGQVLIDTKQIVDRIYFPNGGLVSQIVNESSGAQVEVGVVGREGIVGVMSLLDKQPSLTRSLVQVPHTCNWLPAEILRREFALDTTLQQALMQHMAILTTQSAQSALCNRLHTVEERLCRWLLIIRDRIESNEIEITHEFIGHMLGTRRSSVSIALGTLQRAGFVEIGRGRITLRDDEGIGSCACDCYPLLRERFAQLSTNQ